MKRLLVVFGLWLARLGGWRADACPRPHVPAVPFDGIVGIVKDVEVTFSDHGSEAKRHQALALCKKRYPEARERDLAFGIELAVRHETPEAP